MHHEQATQTPLSTAAIRDPCITGVFQSFRSRDKVIRIEAVLHPATNTFVILWSDIRQCFPGLTRLQHKDIYVPLVRGPTAYRVTPHGIEYQPGIILDVIHDPFAMQPVKIRCNKRHEPEPAVDAESSAPVSIGSAAFVSSQGTQLPLAVAPTKAVQTPTPLSFTTPAASTARPFTPKVLPQPSSTQSSSSSGPSTKVAVSSSALNSDSDEEFIPPSLQSKIPPKEIDPAVIKEFVHVATSTAVVNHPIGDHFIDLATMLHKAFGPTTPDDIHNYRPRPDQSSRPVSLQPKDGLKLPTASIPALGAVKENPPAPLQPSTASLDSKAESSSSGQVPVLNVVADFGEGSSPGAGPNAKIQKRKGRTLRRTKEFTLEDQEDAQLQLMSTATAKQILLLGGKSSVKSGQQSSSSSTSPAKAGGAPTIHDIVAHRAKDVMAARYDWLDSPCSKMFIILPRRDDIASVADVKTLTWQDFDVHFLCDCLDIPGAGIDVNGLFKNSDRDGTGALIPKSTFTEDGVEIEPIRYTGHNYIPHLNIDESCNLSLQKECLAVGPYLMAVLEMLEFGVVIGGKTKVMALQDMDERKKVMYSMAFLMMQGVEASHQLFARGLSSLDEVKPIAPLKPSELADFYRNTISVKRPLGTRIPFRTPEGDVRWVCSTHWNQLTEWKLISRAFDFSKHPDSEQTAFHMNLGTFVVTLKTRERAREFYDLVSCMKSTAVVSFFLDWNLTAEDELELATVPGRMLAACVKIQMRDWEEYQNNIHAHPGFGHGYFKVVLDALKNKQIQAFSIEKRTPGDSADPVDDLYAYKSSVYLDPVLARFCRDQGSSKVQLGLLVTDLDKAVGLVRKGLQGFHSLSKLTLESSYWDHINIDFNANGTAADDVEDTAYVEESEIDYFNRRTSDTITVRTYLSAGTSLLRTNALKDINIRISFPDDGPRIREMIKHSRRLSRIELSIENKDDPCQVFEFFKALMVDHPSLESFQLRKDWGKNNKSNFIWHGVSDRSKMTLAIQSYAEDKIGPLLQKFGSCLLQLYIHNINQQDSVILEKVTGSRKGLKLMAITLVDACALTQPALDDLAKVVLRLNLQRFSITGTVALRTAGRLADFMRVVATKITDIHLFGEHSKVILTELGKRMPESSRMTQLLELKLSGPFDATTKDLTWMRSLFKKELPLSTIELHKVNLSHQGWMTLAHEIDFEHLKYFRVGPEISLKPEAIAAFANLVPENSELENFHLDTDGMKEVHCLSYKAALLPKLRKKTALVSIGRYF
ncbi:hypothetical protein BGX33_007158 [Mortierella sp. NVP41]|nr:hypothetical protein BGX33_007158 [Mortierella sp. NVP41]